MGKQCLKIAAVALMMIFGAGSLSADVFAAKPPVVTTKVSVSPEKAEQIALKAAGGGVVTKFKLEGKAGFAKYDVTVRSGSMKHDIDINAANGKIIKHNQKMVQKPSVNQPASKVTPEEAKKTALDMTKGGEMIKCKYKLDDGVWQYDMTVINGDDKYEVDVNAQTGKVIKYEHKVVTRMRQVPAGNMIKPDSAVAAAMKLSGGGILTKCEFEVSKKSGLAKYDVEIVNDAVKYEYELNALDASLLEYEIDYRYNMSKK